MGELEDKKKKLGIKSMDYTEQKGLYNDFVNVGGKVVELKGEKDKINVKLEEWIRKKEDEQHREQALEERRRQEELDRKRAIAAQAEKEKKKQVAAQQQKTEKQQKQTNPLEEFTAQVAKKINTPKEPHPMQDQFSRLAAKLVCVLYGVMRLFGRRFSRSFLDLTYLELQNYLMDNKQILTSILYQDREISNELRHRLAQTGFPYYYELLYRFDQLYDDEFFTMVKTLQSEKEPVYKAKGSFIRLFKKILMLNRYQPSLYNAMEKSLYQEKLLRNLEESVVTQNLKKLHRGYQMIFFNYYPKLTNLIDYYYKDEIASGKKIAFRDFLGIEESDAIGFLSKSWQEEEEKEKQKKEEEEKRRRQDEERIAREKAEQGENGPVSDEEVQELMTRLPEAVQNGMIMIRQNVNFRDILQYYYDKKDSRMVFPMNDKVFLSYSLIEFFDKEFSFLFVSSGVQYNIFSDQGMRRDTRSVLKDLYFHIDDIIYKRLNEYIKILVEIRKVNTNTYMLPKEQYNRIQQLSIQRGQISRNIRVQCGQLIEDFVKQLQIIIEDYEGEKRIVQNPEETVTFDVRILGQRMSQNQKIINVFRNAFFFSSALRYLILSGELGGSAPTLNNPVFLRIEVAEISPEEEPDVKFEP